MESLPLSEIMTRQLLSLPPEASLGQAVDELARAHVSSILVSVDHQVLGIITEQDVLRAYGNQLPDDTPLADFMNAPVLSAPESMNFREAYHLVTAHQVRHLLVLDKNERPVGIVSLTDFERHLSQAYYRRLKDVQSVMQHSLPTLAAQATVAEAVFAMADYRSSCVIIVAAGKPVGMLTERDVVRLYQHHTTRQQPVLQVMTPNPCCITPHTPVIAAAELMHQRQIRHLPVVDEQGLLVGLVSEADLLQRLESELVDLSSHKILRSRQKLAQAEARWRSVFQQAAQFMWILDAEGYLLEVNASALALIGTPREEVLGHRFRETPWWSHDAEQQTRLQEAIAQALAGHPASFEARYRDLSGQTRWVDFQLRQLDHEEASPHRLLAEGLDVTERHLATRQLRLAAGVFIHSHDAILITDTAGTIIDVNPAFCRLTGYHREAVLGQHARRLDSGHHDSRFFDHVFQEVEQQGYWQGEVMCQRQDGSDVMVLMTISAVRDEHGGTLQHVGILSDITDKKQHEQRLERMAHYDSLTGLPNRTLLGDRLHLALAQAQRRNTRLAVAYLDLDGFKTVNDQFGHHTGDQLLIEVASRLRSHLRASDTAARLGGDEFVLLLNDIGNLAELEVILDRVLESLTQPIHSKGHTLQISASLGITLYPDDGNDGDVLLRHADQAMYEAKRQGQNRYYLFDVAQDQMARELRQLVIDVRQGLAAGQFRLHYQPKVNLCSGLVTGLEALLRWQIPGEIEPRLPGRFLPPLANHEAIEEIGRWVLHQALEQMQAWQAELPHLPVSINLAPRQLQSPEFVADLRRELAHHPMVPANLLELEVLETAALDDLQHTRQVMLECQDLGVVFALDDFGTGYSSLSYVKSLPANTLKIDQSFVREMLDDPDALAIVEGIIGLTAAFQRQVVAEGVESEAHGTLLIRLGCIQAQGYAIARPMPGDQVLSWIRAFEPPPAWVTAAEEQWRREDFPLVAAEVELRHWRTQVEAQLQSGKLARSGQSLGDGQHCRLGRWLATQGRKDYGHLESYAELVRQNDAMHALVKELLQAGQASPEQQQAFARSSEEVIRGLHRLQQMVSGLRQTN